MTAALQSVGRTQVTTAAADSQWQTLYRLGSIAAALAVILIPIAIFVFIAWPPPTTVVGWFTLFQNNRLVALIDFDLLIVVSNVLSILILLALYVALKHTDESLMAIALVLGLVGVTTYIASNPVLSMLSLSDQYGTAATETERSLIVGAGQAMLAIYQGTAFWVSNALGAVHC
jgi:FlaA1/EpsC-like NDP-sugar epimerase